MEIDPVEAEVVRQVFGLYLDGQAGREMGGKAIASYLNERGFMMRRQHWTRTRVHEVLSNRTYAGQFAFNKRDKNGKLKPSADWIVVPVPAIIEEGTFDRTHARLAARRPAKVPPRVTTSPTLLTGLLKCGHCGAGMTLATGKSGHYRYYKCNRRIGQAIHACDCPPVPLPKLDDLVLTALAEKAFAPERVNGMLRELQKRLKAAQSEGNGQLVALTKELKAPELGTERLYEAVERGLVRLDDAHPAATAAQAQGASRGDPD